MIDNQDKQTQPLDLEPAPKRRGRPTKEKALSNAERQRLYRERQKAQRNEIERELHNAYATSKVDEAYSEDIWQELEQAKARIIELEAQLAQRNEKSESHPVPYEEVVAIAQELGERCKSLEERFKAEFELGEKARDKAYKLGIRVAQLEHELEQAKKAQRNEKPSRLNEGMRKMIQDVHEVADAIEDSNWRIQRKSNGGKWKTLMGEYRNEAHAIDTIMSLPPGNGKEWYRAIEVKLKIED